MPLHVKGPLGRCPHSFANFEHASISHISLHLTLDFPNTNSNTTSSDSVSALSASDIKQNSSLHGYVLLTLKQVCKNRDDLSILLLDISSVQILKIKNCTSANGQRKVPYKIGHQTSFLGDCLELDLSFVDHNDIIRIDYEVNLNPSNSDIISNPNINTNSAIQWLSPSQTEGKRYPLAFSQAQSILARSFVPCQDTPAVKQSFDIFMKVKQPLKAVCSGELVCVREILGLESGSDQQQEYGKVISIGPAWGKFKLAQGDKGNPQGQDNNDIDNLDIDEEKLIDVFESESDSVSDKSDSDSYRLFHYHQSQPAQSYLLAFIVGDLQKAQIGRNSFVFAEPQCLSRAQKELKGVTDMYLDIAQSQKVLNSGKQIQIQINENSKNLKVVPGYQWGTTFNVAILPSSFAFGGMENPNCTFFSSSLIASDQSLTTTLAHEIVHSWSGNLVTNRFHKDFWLNEGFTRYIERLILQEYGGREFRGLCLIVGYNDLRKTVVMMEKNGQKELTVLEPKEVIETMDPDQAFSRIPYEKGSLFLFYLEREIVGMGGSVEEEKEEEEEVEEELEEKDSESSKEKDDQNFIKGQYRRRINKGRELMCEWLGYYLTEFQGRSIETEDMKRSFLKHFSSTGAGFRGLCDQIRDMKRCEKIKLDLIESQSQSKTKGAKKEQEQSIPDDNVTAVVAQTDTADSADDNIDRLGNKSSASETCQNDPTVNVIDKKVPESATDSDIDPQTGLTTSQIHDLAKQQLDKIDWHHWLHEPGLPDYRPRVDQTLITELEDLSGYWLTESKAQDDYDLQSQQNHSDNTNENHNGLLGPLNVSFENSTSKRPKLTIQSIRKSSGVPNNVFQSNNGRWKAQQQMVFLDLLIENGPLHPRTVRTLDLEYGLTNGFFELEFDDGRDKTLVTKTTPKTVDHGGFGSEKIAITHGTTLDTEPYVFRNVEVFFRFLLLCIRCLTTKSCKNYDSESDSSSSSSFETSYLLPLLNVFFSRHGRGSYVKPLYLALKNVGKLELAIILYEKHAGFLMDTIRSTMDKALLG